MTIDSQYTPDDLAVVSTQLYPFTFEHIGRSSIVVHEVDSNLDSIGVVPPSGYSVGGLSGQGPIYTGGSVQFVVPHSAGTSFVRISRLTPETQLTDFQPYGPFPAEANEFALDKLTLQIQENTWALANEGLGDGGGGFVQRIGDTMTGNLSMLDSADLRFYDDIVPSRFADISLTNFLGVNLLIVDGHEPVSSVALRARGSSNEIYDLLANNDGKLYWRGNVIADTNGTNIGISPDDYVTLAGAQTITGSKTFNSTTSMDGSLLILDQQSAGVHWQFSSGTIGVPILAIATNHTAGAHFSIAANLTNGDGIALQGLSDGNLTWNGNIIADTNGLFLGGDDFVTIATNQTITGEKTFEALTFFKDVGGQPNDIWQVSSATVGVPIFSIAPTASITAAAHFTIRSNFTDGAAVTLEGLGTTKELRWNGNVIADAAGIVGLNDTGFVTTDTAQDIIATKSFTVNTIFENTLQVLDQTTPTTNWELGAVTAGVPTLTLNTNAPAGSIIDLSPTFTDANPVSLRLDGSTKELRWNGIVIADSLGTVVGGGNFVTLDTEQTITADKTHEAVIAFKDILGGAGLYRMWNSAALGVETVSIDPGPAVAGVASFIIGAQLNGSTPYSLVGSGSTGDLTWNGNVIATPAGVAPGADPVNMVTTDTVQTITAVKTFDADIIMQNQTGGDLWNVLADDFLGVTTFSVLPEFATNDAIFSLTAKGGGSSFNLQGSTDGNLYWRGVVIADSLGSVPQAHDHDTAYVRKDESAWLQSDNAGGILGSRGIASVVKGGTGVYTVNFTEAAPSQYGQGITVCAVGIFAVNAAVQPVDAVSCQVLCFNSAGAAADFAFSLNRVIS